MATVSACSRLAVKASAVPDLIILVCGVDCENWKGLVSSSAGRSEVCPLS